MRNSFNRFLLNTLFFSGLLFFFSTSLIGSEFNWPCWRGPNHDGTSAETNWDTEFLKRPLAVNWEKNVGAGYSNIAIFGSRLYTMGYDETAKCNNLFCFDVKTGKELWRFAYPSSENKFLGPKSSAVIDSGLVYTLSQDGILYCHHAETGKTLWSRDTVAEFGAVKPPWEFSSSARIHGDMLLLNVCKSGIALHKTTGEVLWNTGPGQGNYATPVVLELDKKTYAAIIAQKSTDLVDVENGKVMWSIPWITRRSIVAADPVISGRTLFISSAYDDGSGCFFEISTEKPVLLWRTEEMKTHFSTASVIDGFLYGVDGDAGKKGVLKCLDIKTGKPVWEKNLGFGSFLVAKGHLIYLNESGSLIVIRIDSKQYVEICRKEHILKKLCWTFPVLCRNTVYLRNNKGDLISLDASIPVKGPAKKPADIPVSKPADK